MQTSFNKVKSKINTLISLNGGLPLTQIYEHLLDELKNHYLVKAFLLNEGYLTTEINVAKHNLKKRGIN